MLSAEAFIDEAPATLIVNNNLPANNRFRIGGKLVDKATQKKFEELLEDTRRAKSEAHVAGERCEEAQEALLQVRAELEALRTKYDTEKRRIEQHCGAKVEKAKEETASVRLALLEADVQRAALRVETQALQEELRRAREATHAERALREAKTEELLESNNRGVELLQRLTTTQEGAQQLRQECTRAENNYALALLTAADRHTAAQTAATVIDGGARRISNVEVDLESRLQNNHGMSCSLHYVPLT